MELSSIPIQNPAVLSRKIFDNEIVLVNADSAVSLALTNETAVKVWEMVDGTKSIQDIIDGIKQQFQDVPDNASSDIQDLLELLTQDGLIGFEWNK